MAVCGVSEGKIKSGSKNRCNCCQREATKLHSAKICNGVSSFTLQKEHCVGLDKPKTKSFLLRNKMLFRILY